MCKIGMWISRTSAVSTTETGRAVLEKGSMGTVLDDVTSDTVDAAHIRRRVDDWEERVKGLFAAIGEWLPDGWESRRAPRSSCTSR